MSVIDEMLGRASFPLTLHKVPPGTRPYDDRVVPPDVWGRKSPEAGADLERVLSIPRRQVSEADKEAMVELMGRRLRLPDGPCACASYGRRCILKLKTTQAWALYEAGVASGLLGQIVVGGGKCLDATAEYLDYSSGRRRSVAEAGKVAVASFDEGLTVEQATAFPSGTKRCVRVHLADGSQLVASHDHPVKTQRGWVEAACLSEDDFVAVAASVSEPKVHTKASDDEISLAALMLADGGCTKTPPRFTNETKSVIAEFKRLADTVCGGWSQQASRSNASEFSLLSAMEFRNRWDLYGLAKEKRLHAALWGLPTSQVSLFVNRFWACDGHVSATRVECTLASEKLIDDLRFMLLRLGVRTRKQHTPKKLNGRVFDAWRVVAHGGEALNFLDAVGDVLGKESACQRLRLSLMAKKRNANRDVVPLRRSDLQEICDELGYPGRGKYVRGKRGARPRCNLRAYFGGATGYLNRETFIRFCSEYDYRGKHAHFACPDVAWERVQRVEAVGPRLVYDLNVPRTHNFVANGMVVHNTGLGLLTPMVVKDCKTAVLLVPPKLIEQLKAEYMLWAQHWKVPSLVCKGGWAAIKKGRPVIHVVSLSQLSRHTAATLLQTLAPDTIIIDETHKFKRPLSTRTGRLMNYIAQNPSTKVFVWSGTLTDKSIIDYAHLSGVTLGPNSPLPLDSDEVGVWSAAIDPPKPGSPPGPIGALKALCDPGEPLRSAYRRRLRGTRGVVITEDAGIGASLPFYERDPGPMPEVVASALDDLRVTWQRPDGKELVEQFELSKCARELALGFYYRWIFPRGEPKELIKDWFEARRDWSSEVRKKLKNQEEHLDSPFLLASAAHRYYWRHPETGAAYEGDAPTWGAEHWLRWVAIRDKVKPETEAVWLDDYIAKDAAAWALKHRGVVWYDHVALGVRIAEISGLPMHGGGPHAEERIKAERGDRSIIASLKSHGEGRDGLQFLFKEQLIADPPVSKVTGGAGRWEQCVDAETEILTNRGWLGIASPEWGSRDTKVAAYSPGDETVRWSQFDRVERALGSESMWGIQNPHISLRVTAGHRMLVERAKHVSRHTVQYERAEFVTADDMPSVCRIPLVGTQDASGVPLTNDELTFIGLFMSDGNLDTTNNAISLFQSERYPDVIRLIRRVLRSCGFRYGHSVNTKPSQFGARSPLHKWQISKGMPLTRSDRRLRGWGELEPWISKDFSVALEDMTRGQLEALLLGLWAGDGAKTQGTYDYDRYSPRTRNIATSRKLVADRLQSLCVRRGMRCNVSQVQHNLYMMRISDSRTKWTIKRRASDDRPVWGQVSSNPSEKVWCVRVSTGAIVVRRRGKVAVVGNCLGRLHREGQEADEVDTYVYRHTIEMQEAFDRAQELARYVTETTSSYQKLLACTPTWKTVASSR